MNLAEKYRQLHEASHKGTPEYNAAYCAWKALESENPVAALNGWIEQTQSRIAEFEAMQKAGLLRVADGELVRPYRPDERPSVLVYYDRKIVIFEQALKEIQK
jgi:hypothetical protein